MLFEPTTLATIGKLVAETLHKNYLVDATALFREVGLEPSQTASANARYPWLKMQALLAASARQTGDPCIGLVIGNNVRPTSFHALGFSWLASPTLFESLNRLRRYYHVVTTVPVHYDLTESEGRYIFTADYTDPRYQPTTVAIDAGLMAILKLCRTATSAHFCPLSVSITHDDLDQPERYVEAFGAPVQFSAEVNAIYFDKASLEAPLPGDNLDLVTANDKVAEHYIETLEPQRVASDVKKLLLDLLPSGDVHQNTIAGRLNRSLSTLQRQLKYEGTNFQQIRDATRHTLAEDYIRDGKLSVSQIAYLLGFSDQSNFSRAFKRWTGSTPKRYQSQL